VSGPRSRGNSSVEPDSVRFDLASLGSPAPNERDCSADSVVDSSLPRSDAFGHRLEDAAAVALRWMLREMDPIAADRLALDRIREDRAGNVLRIVFQVISTVSFPTLPRYYLFRD